jgi:predicted Holliday junction resolvase-like endonuclease
MVWLVPPPLLGASWSWESGAVWFVEVKAGPTEPLNDNEEEVRAKIEAVGKYYRVVRSVDDVERLLRR